MTKKEENQMVKSVRDYASATRKHDATMASQNYRDAAVWTDRAAIARQNITRFAALLEARAAQQRAA